VQRAHADLPILSQRVRSIEEAATRERRGLNQAESVVLRKFLEDLTVARDVLGAFALVNGEGVPRPK
jgi:hypothetical protein